MTKATGGHIGSSIALNCVVVDSNTFAAYNVLEKVMMTQFERYLGRKKTQQGEEVRKKSFFRLCGRPHTSDFHRNLFRRVDWSHCFTQM